MFCNMLIEFSGIFLTIYDGCRLQCLTNSKQTDPIGIELTVIVNGTANIVRSQAASTFLLNESISTQRNKLVERIV